VEQVIKINILRHDYPCPARLRKDGSSESTQKKRPALARGRRMIKIKNGVFFRRGPWVNRRKVLGTLGFVVQVRDSEMSELTGKENLMVTRVWVY
jgi:hypothetical protein